MDARRKRVWTLCVQRGNIVDMPSKPRKPAPLPEPSETADQGKSEQLRLRLSAEEKTLFATAARREGMSLSAWLRWVARRAASKHDERA